MSIVELRGGIMAGSPERQQPNGAIDKGLDAWQTLNKVTLAGSIGVAILVPALAVPALTLAVVDGVQIVAINEAKKHRKKAANDNHA